MVAALLLLGRWFFSLCPFNSQPEEGFTLKLYSHSLWVHRGRAQNGKTENPPNLLLFLRNTHWGMEIIQKWRKITCYAMIRQNAGWWRLFLLQPLSAWFGQGGDGCKSVPRVSDCLVPGYQGYPSHREQQSQMFGCLGWLNMVPSWSGMHPLICVIIISVTSEETKSGNSFILIFPLLS